MNNEDIIITIDNLIKECKSPFLNIYIRFYINDKLLDSKKIEYFFGYKLKGVSFGKDLLCLLSNNFHYNDFEFISSTLRIGKIQCHGHGEYYGIDTLIIIFNRSVTYEK